MIFCSKGESCIREPDDGRARLLEFIGDSFVNTKVESPLFVDSAFQLLEKYSNGSKDEVDVTF